MDNTFGLFSNVAAPASNWGATDYQPSTQPLTFASANGSSAKGEPTQPFATFLSRYNFSSWLEASEQFSKARDLALASHNPPKFETVEPPTVDDAGNQKTDQTSQTAQTEEQKSGLPTPGQAISATTQNLALNVSTITVRFSGLKPNSGGMFLRDVTEWGNPEYAIKADARGYARITMKMNIDHVYWGEFLAEKDKTNGGGFYKVFLFVAFQKGAKNIFAFNGSLFNAKTPNARLGSWVGRNPANENQVHFAKSSEAKALTPAFELIDRVSHLKKLVSDVENGSRLKIAEMKDIYNTWSTGKKLIPSLGALVWHGSLFARSTFWDAFNRLTSAIRFNEITNFIKREANLSFNPIIADPKSPIKGLSAGTSALQGFLVRHPEVNGNQPIKVIKDGKIIAYNKAFSLWIRQSLVELNYTIKGDFARGLKIALKKAASDGSDLGFLIDGANDAWDPATKRTRPTARELQSQPFRIPALPVLHINTVNAYRPPRDPFTGNLGETAPQLLANIQATAMAAQVAAATTQTMFERGINFTLRNQREVYRRAGNDRNTEFLTDIVRFLTIPGVLITGNIYGEGGRVRPLNQEDIHALFQEGDNGEGAFSAFQARLMEEMYNYFANPTLFLQYEAVHELFRPGNVNNPTISLDEILLNAVAEGRIQNFRILNADDTMRLINTLMIGNEAPQGLRFTQNPWLALIEEEFNGIRRFQENLRGGYFRYMGNADVQRFGYNVENLLMLIRNIVPQCVR